MRIVWSVQARSELFDIAEFYDRSDPTLADEIVARVEAGGLPLLDFPSLGMRIDAAGTRRWRVRGTPFLLFYTVDGERIDILGVSHDRSNWREHS
jgi:plasmid stabilization system protein ParE